jgi:hypothetical protein
MSFLRNVQLSKLRGADARWEADADGEGEGEGEGMGVSRPGVPKVAVLLPSVGEELSRGGVIIFLSS